MKIPLTGGWDVTPAQAVQIQRELATKVIREDQVGQVRWVAGVDVGFEGPHSRTARSAVVVLRYPELVPVDCAVAQAQVSFPYVPGLLSFREIPVILRALDQIRIDPDVIIADGHGLSHPRRMGFASHLGLVLDLPTIGCAKSILVGEAAEPKGEAGAWTPLVDQGEIVGAALRTRERTRPVYVSVGHRVSLELAVKLVMACCKGYRLPETTRYAHRAASGERIPLDEGHG